jgi:flagellar biosynthesis GTPase FlhF
MKLAAAEQIRSKHQLVAVSLGKYHYGDSRLKQLCELVHIPHFSSDSESDLKRIYDANARTSLFIIDTERYGARDEVNAAQLEVWLRSISGRRRVLLTLGADTSEILIERTIKHYARYGVDGLAITKYDQLDDATEFSRKLTERSSIPQYMTSHGQRIPQDLEVSGDFWTDYLLTTSTRYSP